MAKKVTEELGIEVANFPEYKNITPEFDVVSLRHVLEHLPDSIAAMNKISGLLKNKGFAIIEVPNIESIVMKFQRFFNRINIIKKKYSANYVSGHCNEFGIEAFKNLLQKTGFCLIEWETYSKKPISNFIYNKIKTGAHMRCLIQKKD